jgi:hypothetical protein
MNSRFKFPRRVRIHGGECGAVARALHHEVRGLSLYQADSKKAFGSTFNERKQMSTKTTLKRIALVAVSALGFGLLSVMPANANSVYTATYTAPTALTVVQGYDSGTAVGTIQVKLTADTSTLATADSATLTIKSTSSTAVSTTNSADKSNALLQRLGLLTSAASTVAFNATNNGTVELSGAASSAAVQRSVSVLTTAANFITAEGRANLVLWSGLTAADHDGAAVEFTLTVVRAGRVSTLNSQLVVRVASATSWVAGTSTTTPTTGLANVAAGATGSMTLVRPYTAPANASLAAAQTFTFSNTNVPGSTFNVTATATGGVVTMVRNSATEIQSNFLKDSIAGAFSVTYTVSVTMPATATQGQSVSVNGVGTYTVFGGAVYNGAIATPTRVKGSNGWLSGGGELFAPATAGSAAGSITVDAQTSATPTLNPAWVFTLSGVGTISLDSGTTKVAYAEVAAGSASSRTVNFYADGRAGKATLTVTANGNTVATQVVNYYGAATEIKVTPVYTIARAGNGATGYSTGDVDSEAAATGCGGADCTPARQIKLNVAGTATDNDPSMVVEVLDALGTRLPIQVGVAGGVSMVSSNTAVISSGATETFLDAGVPLLTAGALVNHVTYSSTPSAKSGDKATLTFSYVNTLGTTLTKAVDVTVGGTKTGGTVTVSLDKKTYAPGEKMVLTVTAVDSSGNPVYDNASTGNFSSNKNVVGIDNADYYYLGGQHVYGDEAGENLYAPAASGDFTITLSSGTATGAEVTVTATVSDDAATAAAKKAGTDATAAAEAAGDAAAEAIDAANAATDAANLAAEAADAATVAAEEARDAADAATAAVEELATQVATLMAALKAQITTLANTVAKIAKKVKA